ncbi:sigma 54-interacting transcriptional regulator [Caloramator sp. mosi_1]|uniref:sigma-54 interaction domain-containing protein n=1 Tax=Caloramator sp. mosi_1 TaxID=3023090 RepID=UPI00236100BC|nr:sigma 54-interacting transcriptional regulator [Caloramator sp. mosi_1]WDC84728.1 sigma 54-interacting transcriptional regulator [Caloramator sp. mosi_1]
MIITNSPKMKECINIAKKIAKSDYTVLINGESGTGKEMIAQSIHNYSNRSIYPFVAVNCAALPENLLESELFGYEKGAFTGALKEGKIGLFEIANNGTIFLDEIGDMPLKLQTRLLRVLQEKQIMRVGSDNIINVNVRVIAATNKDLKKLVDEGLFREDLYYRINVLPISLPPLRERKEDIMPLLESFLKEK